MAYLRGKDVKVYITTENTGAGVDLSGNAAAANAGASGMAAGTGVGKLGNVTTMSDTEDAFINVEGVAYNPGAESETKNLFGSSKERIIPQRQTFDVSITVTGRGRELAKLAAGARWGASSSSVLFDGLDDYSASTGYLLYIIQGGKASVLYHAIIPDDGFKEELDPQKVSVQTIKFVGNLWDPDVAVGSLGTAMALE